MQSTALHKTNHTSSASLVSASQNASRASFEGTQRRPVNLFVCASAPVPEPGQQPYLSCPLLPTTHEVWWRGLRNEIESLPFVLYEPVHASKYPIQISEITIQMKRNQLSPSRMSTCPSCLPQASHSSSLIHKKTRNPKCKYSPRHSSPEHHSLYAKKWYSQSYRQKTILAWTLDILLSRFASVHKDPCAASLRSVERRLVSMCVVQAQCAQCLRGT